MTHHYPCDLCGQPSGDDAPACTGCAYRAVTALRQVHGTTNLHGLDVDLDISIAKASEWGLGLPGTNPKGAAPPLLIDPRASEARVILHNTLATWCRTVHDDTHVDIAGPACRSCTHPSCRQINRTGLPDDNLAAMARWLAPLITWARRAPYGAELVDEVLAAVAQARRAVDRPAGLTYAGRCADCGAGLYALGDRQVAVCRTEECQGGVSGVEAARVALLRAAPGRLVTAEEAARALSGVGRGVSARWIRQLAQDGELASIPGKPAARYRLGDILDLLLPSHGKASA